MIVKNAIQNVRSMIFFSFSNLVSPRSCDFGELRQIKVINRNSCGSCEYHDAVPLAALPLSSSTLCGDVPHSDIPHSDYTFRRLNIHRKDASHNINVTHILAALMLLAAAPLATSHTLWWHLSYLVVVSPDTPHWTMHVTLLRGSS